jgi:hypothetical protein
MIANYIRNQEDEDKRLDQLTLLTKEWPPFMVVR